jgi:hypothetical protein
VDASRGFEVPLHRVDGAGRSDAGGRSRAHGRRPFVAWMLILVTVSGAAVVGRLAGAGPDVRPIASPVDAIAMASPARPPDPIVVPEIIVLSSPAVANASITTRQLAVRGYLATGTGRIEITLEARGNRIIDSATIEPSLVFGERPTVGRHAQFEARFGLPNPRPNGRMFVQVALVDEGGRIIDVIRRPIRVGPLLEGTGA